MIKLTLRDSKGVSKDYYQEFIPFSKRLDYIRLERELESVKDSQGNVIQPTADQYDELQTEFVASLFDDKKVTKRAILDGLDSCDREQIYDIVRYRVLGFKKEEDDKTKKILEELAKAGENSTTSSLISSEEL